MNDPPKMVYRSTDMDKHFIDTDSKIHGEVLKGYSVYPDEWVIKSDQRGTLTSKFVDRGNYDDYNQTINISGDNSNDSFKTSIHELGHRFEKAVPIINELETVFYQRRTNGEVLEKLKDLLPNDNYNDDEITRKDNFIHPYMGKDYGGDGYELVSMGFENAFCDPSYLDKDPDYANFIYGILTLI